MRWSVGRMVRSVCAGLAVLVTVLGVGAVPTLAEDYVIGPEDVLSVSVWMHPELTKDVSVNADGNLTFPPIGEIKAAGQTTVQLASRIGDRLSTYLRQTTTVTVTVSQFLSHSVYVSGGVAHPGRFGFEHIPSLIDVISQAGGAIPGADLGAVQIIRREGDARRTLTADVATALRDGSTGKIPALRPGDTVIVPAGGPEGSTEIGSAVGVLGEVNKPGLYPAGGGQDLWNILAAAGGLTQRGNLRDVRIVTRQRNAQAVVTVNLRDALERGTRQPVTVKPGDVVYVGSSGAGAWNAFVQVMSVGRDLLNVAVAVEVLRRGN